MLIDWFTVGAQALNFLILVWLMKRFLYQPILHAIDEREKRIAAELSDADAKKAEAQKERDEFQHKNEEFDQQRAELLSKAMEDAKAERQRLLDEARQAADTLSAKRQETLRNDAHLLNQAISRRTQQEVFAIARKALTDLATTSLEERLGEVFTRRLREMDGQAKEGLAEALKTAIEPSLVRSAFDLPAEQRAVIQNALNETFSAEVHIRFETAPDLISGIEFTTANGQKVAWSIADYLVSLEKGVDELLKEKDKPIAKAKPNPDAKVEPEPEAQAKPKPKPEAKVEPEPDAQAESNPEAKVELEPETQADPNPDAKFEPEPKVQTKPETDAQVVPKPEAKAEPKPEEKSQ
jgi:F-type H+-transporting ATPase subunit b